MDNKLREKVNSVPAKSDCCTGCSACSSICPTHAIKMSIDKEGFYAPVFNKDLCTSCKLCQKVCPILNFKFNTQPNETFAVMAKDEKIRLSCSSGGVAYILSKYVIEQGGYVCGCITDNFRTYHEIISKDNYHLFERLKGSKYVQSDLGDVFIRIKTLLKNNKFVLFIGSGCQVAGLKNFLVRPYKNLITVDFICHGVPSPKVLNDYISYLKKTYYTAVTYSTRDKIDGWQGAHEFNLFNDAGKRVYRANGKFDLYISGFLSKCITRQSCINCKFAKSERGSDITLGDYWKIKKFKKEYDDKKGTSLVMYNSEEGKELLQKTKQYFSLFAPVPLDFAKSVQPHLSTPPGENKNRKKFFELFKNGGNYFSFLNRKLFRVGILNFHFANNYGAVLGAYALQTAIKKLGYVPEIINFAGKKFSDNSVFTSFRENFLSTSELIEDFDGLIKLQRKYKSIVVGSDQVWHLFDQNVYMLKFASGRKNLISYAASFGATKYKALDENQAKTLLSRFSAISVREFNGVEICEKQFQLPAVRLVDPTLLLSPSDYQTIINFYNPNQLVHDYIGYAFENKDNKNIIGHFEKVIQNKINLGFKNILTNYDTSGSNTLGGWLNDIKNAKFIVSDSFHVIVLSIVFKKEFVCLVSPSEKTGRLESLLKLFGLDKKRIINNIDEFDQSIMHEKINYENVYHILENEKEKAMRYLADSLNKEPEELPVVS